MHILRTLLFLSVGLLVGCQNDRSSVDDKELAKPVHYSLGGTKLDIPLGYHYLTFEKHKKWPAPPQDRREVESIFIAGMLPDIAPYSTKQKIRFGVRGGGDKIVISVIAYAGYPLEERVAKLRNSPFLVSETGRDTANEKYAISYGMNPQKIDVESYVIKIDNQVHLIASCDANPKIPFKKCEIRELRNRDLS